MHCVDKENVYNGLHFNVYTEKYTLCMVASWRNWAECQRMKDYDILGPHY